MGKSKGLTQLMLALLILPAAARSEEGSRMPQTCQVLAVMNSPRQVVPAAGGTCGSSHIAPSQPGANLNRNLLELGKHLNREKWLRDQVIPYRLFRAGRSREGTRDPGPQDLLS